jgi:hypothetical protein
MTVKLECPVCGDYGVLMKKKTITQTAKRKYRYEKWYVYHNKSKGTTQKWCYLSKEYLRLPEISEAIFREQATQNNPITTQNASITTQRTNNLNLSSIQQKNRITPFLPVSQANTHQQCMSTRTG